MGCCTSNSCSCHNVSLPVGPAGPAGPAGVNGIHGGFSSVWTFNLGNPGTGQLAFRESGNYVNSFPTGVLAELIISSTNKNGIPVGAMLAEFLVPSGNGYLTIYKEDDNSVFGYYKISNGTTVTNPYQYSIKHIHSNGSLATGDTVVVTFTPLELAESVVEYVSGVTVTSSTPTPVLTYTGLSQGYFVNDGDTIYIDGSFTALKSGSSADWVLIQIEFDGNVVGYGFPIISSNSSIQLLAVITRDSANDIHANILVNTCSNNTGIFPSTIGRMADTTSTGSNIITVSNIQGTVEVKIAGGSNITSVSADVLRLKVVQKA